MKRIALVVLLAFAGFAGTQPVVPTKFFTGAKPTPPARIIESLRLGRAGIHAATAPPPQVVVVPKRLSYWGNDRYGVCVSSESAFSLLDFTRFVGLDEVFVTDATVIAWAQRHGWLNGANLLEVIEAMQTEGIKDEKGILRKAGKVSAVSFSNQDTLKSAIAQGPVSIAIDHTSLPSGAGNKSGWYSFGGRTRNNTDHCVSLHGYGPCAELFKALGVPLPPGAPANGYLLFTWSTVGVVDYAWIMNTTVEAWVRNPTVTELDPPPPPVTPVAVTCPDLKGSVGVPVKFTPTATGGIAPYIYLYDYGDATQDSAGTHTYTLAGKYIAKVTGVDSKGNSGSAYSIATITGTDPPLPPIPGKSGTIQWTIGGVTQTYELFPIGSRDAIKKFQDAIGPIAP